MDNEMRRARPQKLAIEKLHSNILLLALLSVVFITIALYLMLASQSLVDQTAAIIGFASGLLVLAFALLFFAWPILTPNLLTPTKLVVRFGGLFNLSIPLSNIESVKRLGPAGPVGTKYSLIDKRYSVLRSRNNAVKIVLRKEMTTGLLLRRDVKELVIDCSEPDRLVRRIGGSS